MDAKRIFASLLRQGLGFKALGNHFNTSIFEADHLWNTVHISAILACIYLWVIEEQKYEQTVLE